MLRVLLKNNAVDIYRLLLTNYRQLNLDEIELVILMNLFLDCEKGKRVLKFQAISQRMSISIDECSSKLQSLMNRGFIEINVTYDKQNKAVESFDLTPTLKKLEDIFKIDISQEKNKVIVDLLNENGVMMSPTDMNIIVSWAKYDVNNVNDAILKAKANNILTVKYIDAIIKGQDRLEPTVSEDTKQKVQEFMRSIKR